MNIKIQERVHELYWENDINCARTMLICLSELFNVKIEEQTMSAAIGLHGAGGFRAQCGLVEGTLMFIGIYFSKKGWIEKDIASLCYQFADEFVGEFGSLSCYNLRPNGFNENDPPHVCELLTNEAIEFTELYIKKLEN